VRPLYETGADRENERQIIERVAATWGLDFAKMKISNVIDYALLDNKRIVAVAEVKCRNYSSEQITRMGGLILSAGKVSAAKDWVGAFNVSFVLLVGLTDGLFYMSVSDPNGWPEFSIEMAGRRDRGDWQDIEPCCVIPMELFTRFDDAEAVSTADD
jgi:hypothetical protein